MSQESSQSDVREGSPSHSNRPGRSHVRVVGIGASAGGLQPLQEYFAGLAMDTGAAYVVVQHLSPDFKSLMKELLARHTKLPIERVEDGVALKPDTVFLLPPKMNIVLDGDVLRLSHQDPLRSHGPNFPIDVFFQSLAEVRGEEAIAVVLSGTGTDGTRGIQRVHDEGGVVIVQDPGTAQFDGMPQSALETGAVDYCVSPAECASVTQAVLRGEVPRGGRSPRDEMDHPPHVVDQIIQLISSAGELDFTGYRRTTVVRRIHRRMMLISAGTAEDYLELLKSSSDEQQALRDDLLINVTEFFRDEDPWHVLESSILPELIEGIPNGESLRVWVTACSTGQEAYSVAILGLEAIEMAGKQIDLKVFATDVDSAALSVAASGSYSTLNAAAVGKDRLLRFFNEDSGRYTAKPRLRRSIVFARHDLTHDPPFTRMHLVLCRNLLIYLEPRLQHRVLSSLRFSLLNRGILLLGSAEALGQVEEDFETVDARQKLFRKIHDGPLLPPDRGSLHAPRLPPPIRTTARHAIHWSEALMGKILDEDMRAKGSALIVVNLDGTLLHSLGETKDLLRLSVGRAALDLASVIEPGLLLPVTTAMSQVKRDGGPVLYSGISYGVDGDKRLVDIRAARHQTGRESPEVVSLLFSPSASARRVTEIDFRPDAEAAARIRELEMEVQSGKETLQTAIEELETTNEEQQATNEELLASNEELQSTNEELHSVNEELQTVNAEYQSKIHELVALHNDIDNLLRSTDIGTIFLDGALRIRKFTPAAGAVINLLSQDVGRPIEHLSPVFEDPEFMLTIRRVNEQGQPAERPVTLRGGLSYLLRIHPYRNEEGAGAGVVLTFVDVTALRKAELAVRELQGFQKAIIDAIFAHLAILDEQGRIVMVNEAWKQFAQANGYSDQSMGLGVNYLDICDRSSGPESECAKEVQDGLRAVIAGRRQSFVFEYPCHSPSQRRWFLMRASRFFHAGKAWAIVAHLDVTDRRIAEERRTMLVAELDHRVKNTLSAVIAIAQRSMDSVPTVDQFQKAFIGRLNAMARCHEALARTNWGGGSLREMVNLVTSAYEAQPSGRARVFADGDDVLIPARAAQALGLALHEMATNAAKYGALSSSTGSVRVAWALRDEGGVLTLTWVESGGPTVTPPTRRGLGTELIHGLIEHDLHGSVVSDYKPEGITYALLIPLQGFEDVPRVPEIVVRNASMPRLS